MRFFLCQLLLLLVVESTFAAPILDSGSGPILLYKRTWVNGGDIAAYVQHQQTSGFGTLPSVSIWL